MGTRGTHALLAVLAFTVVLAAGCVQQQANAQVSTQAGPTASPTPSIAATATPAASASPAASVAGSAGEGAEAGLQFKEWSAPDGSITLQVPDGWTATERQVGNCTANWAVTAPSGTSEAFMNNQMLVFKSEDARGIYKAYGLAGADAAPVSAYLAADQAVAQVVAPLSGSSGFQVAGTDAELAQLLSQATCIPGLAACDAQAFDATYIYKGMPMKGVYLAASFDLGDGSTWWINLWGYSSPAAEWDASRPVLEKIFTSAQYTESWKQKCGGESADVAGIVKEVIDARRIASENAARQWDEHISG